MSLPRSAVRALLVAAVVAAAGLVGTAPALATPPGTTGPQSVLLMLAYWGNPPAAPSGTDVDAMVSSVHSWFTSASYGNVDVSVTATDWLTIGGPTEPGATCQDSKSTLMDQAKQADGYPTGYQYYVLYFPACANDTAPSWSTLGGEGVWLNGSFSMVDIVRGLTRNMGVAAGTDMCPGGDLSAGCTFTAEADPFDLTGQAATAWGLNAASMQKLGWLAGTTGHAITVSNLTSGGTATLTALHGNADTTVAFVNPGGGAQTYWLEHRGTTGIDGGLPDAATDGVLLHRISFGLPNQSALVETRFDDGSGDIWTIRDGDTVVLPERYQISVGPAAGGEQVTVTAPKVLTVTRNGTGTGKVTSNPTGIDCGVSCTNSFLPGTSVTLTETPATGSTFAGWSGACSGTPTTCTVTMSTARSVTATFNSTTPPSTRVEESAAGLDGWSVVSDGTASGGSYRMSVTKNNTATFTSAKSTSLTWLTRKGPQYGNAIVTIDGVSKGTVNLAASSEQAFSQTFTGLPSKAHKLVIKVAGTHASPSTGNGVVVDGFIVGGTTTQESAKQVTFDAWKATAATGASGGLYRSTSKLNATATYTFTGTSVDWITATGPKFGKAAVRIDNGPEQTIDLYAPTTVHLQQVRTFSAGGSGTHTIRVRVLNTKNASSGGTAVPVDAFVVH